MLQKLATLMTIILLTLNPVAAQAQDASGGGLVDDSLRDMTIVFGTGLFGAVLGLSTLSFVEEPSKHTKNIAVGGAVGIIIGVGVVVFNQASRNALAEQHLPLNLNNFDSIKRNEFKEVRIVENNALTPTFNYDFTF
jgi:hypothetical protein